MANELFYLLNYCNWKAAKTISASELLKMKVLSLCQSGHLESSAINKLVRVIIRLDAYGSLFFVLAELENGIFSFVTLNEGKEKEEEEEEEGKEKEEYKEEVEEVEEVEEGTGNTLRLVNKQCSR
uniref:Uncharacterized protein n=1 Tax=Vespula pensylvanica TaxID=30213 RepID=A0A834P2R8_VESPE|nr:hypothetical protein H0235_008275 [Vespula pensylvanica]